MTSAAHSAVRVLIADDEPLIVTAVRTVLTSEPGLDVVAEAADGRAAVEAALRHRVDVAVLDITMPRLDGLSAAEELRRRAPDVRTVMLTAFGDAPNVLRALAGGVAGFVLKNCTPQELVAAVRAAHRGDAYLSPAVTRMVLGRVVTPDDLRRRHDAVRRLAALSARERDVVELLAEGLPNAEIGRRVHMTETSVKTYVSRALAKLGCANRVQAALLVRDAEPHPMR
ncbi:response regulator transcription factor [Streptomyces sp. RFCAC02]|uniref:response regulator n=1 Tax=Streptomyces sp. RFCAC02 TaxID=2499143 RepID=UPI001F0ED9EE|nr:response regulator transcription factor [Streptomyces sp. RFCAC02]